MCNRTKIVNVPTMSFDIQKFLETQQHLIIAEKKRLGLLQDSQAQHDSDDLHINQTSESPSSNKIQSCTSILENKENICTSVTSSELSIRNPTEQKLPLVERLDLGSIDGNLEKNKQAFIDKLVNSENPLSFRSNDGSCTSMLRYGEYSPNNPQFRVAAAPYIGFGEYEQRKQLFSKQRKADYLQHLTKKNEQITNTAKSILLESRPVCKGLSKSVQTDIQNIHTKLIQYELHSQDPAEKELSPQVAIDNCKNTRKSTVSKLDNLSNYKRGDVESRVLNLEMDKPKSILSKRTGTARERMMSEYHQSNTPSFLDGFSFQESKAELFERERLKREAYQADLRQQIEEKRRLSAYREEQERRQQELENRRLEQQLLRMQEEELMDQRRSHEQFRRNSEDYSRRKQEQQSRSLYRRHVDSESSSVVNSRNTNVASKPLSHYSPPISRRNPYSFNIPSSSVFSEPLTRYNPNKRFDSFTQRRDTLSRLDSLNTYDTNNSSFSRYDSLSRIDSLKRQDSLSRQLETLSVNDNLNRVQRRHSATQQDLSVSRRSPKLQRRSSSSRFDDTLPIPVLKAHSPVAKELRNSVAVNSSRSSEALRRLEDKWQVPAVQRNIINHGDPLRDGPGKSILTQLGAIRMQLQQEQLRMDETLRQRSITQSKAVDFH